MEYEKFYGKIINTGSSKAVIIPARLLKALNWDEKTELIVMVKENKENVLGER